MAAALAGEVLFCRHCAQNPWDVFVATLWLSSREDSQGLMFRNMALKQSIALLMIPDVLPKVPVSFSGSLPPAVDHVCPRRQGVPQAVKSGSPARTGHPAARAGRSPGAEPPPETGGHGLPGTPRAQPVWSRVRRGTRASVLGLRQQTSGAPASARGETGPKARHPGQPWGEDLNSNTREEQVDI